MRIIKNKYSKLITFISTIIFMLLIAYVLYNMISGEKGLLSMIRLQQDVDSAREELIDVNVEKMKLKHKVNMMYPQSLDKDLVDEQARKLLGYAADDEIIILDKKPATKASK